MKILLSATLFCVISLSGLKAQHVLSFNIPPCPQVNTAFVETPDADAFLYPNPSEGTVFIKTSGPASNTLFSIEFFNILGTSCLSQTFSATNNMVYSCNIESLPPGIYMVRIKSTTLSRTLTHIKQ